MGVTGWLSTGWGHPAAAWNGGLVWVHGESLPHPLGFIDASGDSRDLARSTLAGVPLGLWAVRNLCLAMPRSSVVAACDRPAMARLFERVGVRVIEATKMHGRCRDASDIFARLERPFCLPESANRALVSSNPELINEQNTPIERLRITGETDRRWPRRWRGWGRATRSSAAQGVPAAAGRGEGWSAMWTAR